RIVHAQPEAIARFNYNLPAELEVIIKKALRKNREERYQSARDLLADLQDLDRELEFASRMEHSVAPSMSDSRPPSANSESATEILTSGEPSLITSEMSATPTHVSSADHAADGIKKHQRAAVAALLVLLLAVGGISLLYFRHRQANASQIESIAV